MQTKPAVCGFLAAVFAMGLFSSSLSAADAAVLTVRADTWMPFNGEPQEAKPGYVIEMLREVFEPLGTKVDYAQMPYEEALTAVRGGAIDAVIGPDETEGKGLILPKQPMGKPCILLLTQAKGDFSYENIRSLRGAKLGVIKGYTYWDALDVHIAKKQGVVFAEGDEPLAELFAKMHSGAVTVLAEMESVLLWYLRQNKMDRNDFKAVYRHSAQPLYVAFASNDKGRALSAQFDEGISKLRSSGRLAKLLASYGLKDWDGAE